MREEQFVAPVSMSTTVSNQSVRKTKGSPEINYTFILEIAFLSAVGNAHIGSLEGTGPGGEMQATHINEVGLEPLSQVFNECIFTLVVFQQHEVLHSSMVASVQGAFNAFSKGLPSGHCYSMCTTEACLVVEEQSLSTINFRGRAQNKSMSVRIVNIKNSCRGKDRQY